jgi:LysR family glycine cleavage system transcriptional activator
VTVVLDAARAAAPGRRMPSLDALRAFEVAARRLSFTAAADELCVTQGAVSQRIKALELELGVALFDRVRTGLVLTPQGEALAQGVRQGLHRIAVALDGLGEPGAGAVVEGRLALSVLPSLASCWLMPRLPRFQARHPGIEVQVSADPQYIDLAARPEIDLALRFGDGNYPGLVSARLMGDSVTPVCSPSLLARVGAIDSVAALAGVPVLHDAPTESDASGSGWQSWLVHVGAPGLKLPAGQRFNQAALTLEAAALGLGVALARASLVAEHIAARRLVRLRLPSVPTAYSYYAVATPAAASRAPVQAMLEWLVAETSG